MKPYAILLSLAILSVSCNHGAVVKLKAVETYIEERPDSALHVVESIDTNDLKTRGAKSLYALMYSMALDKNHVNDGRLANPVGEAADWYGKFGSRKHRRMARYYYGDQLRDAGRLEEAAVQLLQSEKEASAANDWFFAGMSARSLYYIFGRTHNYSEELSCIERAVRYFHLSGKEIHEDDARIKLAIAYFDNSLLDVADSLFDAAIEVAIQKKDTVRFKIALVNSVDAFLVESQYRPDSVITRLIKAEEIGYRPNAPAFADYGLAYALQGEFLKSEQMFESAYACIKDEREKAFVSERDYARQLAQRDSTEAFRLLRYLYPYVNKEAKKTLEQSVVKAQNSYLASIADKVIQEQKVKRLISFAGIIIAILLMILLYLLYKRRYKRILEEEAKCDEFKFACEELGSLGFKSFDKIVDECYSLGKNGQTALMRAYKRLVAQFQNEGGFNEAFVTRVDKSHEYVISRLKEQIPELGDNQVLLFACMVQGLSYTTMTFLMSNKDKQYLYDRRQSLIKKINEKDPIDKELFLSYLPNRPTRVK